MNELDPASREQFDEMLVSTSIDLWKKIQGRPNEARAFLDVAVAALRREQERTKLKQAVLRYIIGMGMKRLRDEGVEVKQIVSRTRLDDQVGKRVSRAWVDKHMLTGDQMKEIADVFSRAERAYDQIANDRDVFTATRAGARRTSNQLRGLMRWIGVRLSGAAAVVGATWAATECGSGPGTVTLAAGGLLATAASRFAGGPSVPGLEPATVHLSNGAGGAGGLSSLNGMWSGTAQVSSAASASAASSGHVAAVMTKVTVGVVTSVQVFAGVSAPVATTLVAMPAAIAAAPAAHQAANDLTNTWLDQFGDQPDNLAQLASADMTPAPPEGGNEPDANVTPSQTTDSSSPAPVGDSSPARTPSPSAFTSQTPSATKTHSGEPTATTAPTAQATPTSSSTSEPTAGTTTPPAQTDPEVTTGPSSPKPSPSPTVSPTVPPMGTLTPSPSPQPTDTPSPEPTSSTQLPTAVPEPTTPSPEPSHPETDSPAPTDSPSEPTSVETTSVETPSPDGGPNEVRHDARPPASDTFRLS
ncbi:hypothetical protein AB0F17_61965 [Nonomuraea sp. NPDC026600]|uniref:hypothetical protein n=1 Tax=Nonomuraea sp. NPDC026600 TaxID=3155363 RepID=UPI0033E3C9FD